MKKMIAITLASLLLLTGCAGQEQSATAPTAPQEETASVPVQEGQRLNLTVVPEEGSLEAFPMPQGTEKTYGDLTYAGVKDVRVQLPGGEKALAQALSDGDISLGEIFAYAQTYGDLTYAGVKDVRVQLPGGEKALAQALSDGDISLGEIFAYAQLDAQNGFCQGRYTSKNGLAQYYYMYPEYRLYLVNDIYELPNGTAIPVQELSICDLHKGGSVTSVYTDEAGNILDVEDWGLTWSGPAGSGARAR